MCTGTAYIDLRVRQQDTEGILARWVPHAGFQPVSTELPQMNGSSWMSE